ncbi:Na(+)-translocating NADH-quinone reductase subunit A [Candidatus Laterigemmans baculatus]|uniref:Na(+)-translocating NADH-quinone reductase subunit A n=1 Tax=Candidatus Laterigemmans baculatus TaxID=2770505 RepID=UPI0013D938E3|nr:Na(+)-translocating NADH-quinone reductase subunit A [Candidatus Laterigemmans baculatus]
MTVIKRGLDIPVAGAPEQHIEVARHIDRVGLVGDDYIGMKPTMLVQEGDRVKLGQVLFEDKKTPGVQYTAPAAGRVVEINRGLKRKFESLVIEVAGDEAVDGERYSEGQIAGLGREKITTSLLSIGLWPSLRTRPFGRVPKPGSVPQAIFVQAIDTNPLAADPTIVLAGHEHHFTAGLAALTQLTDGTVYVCKAPDASLPGEGISGVRFETFSGPHPAGLPGTHIHFLEPVGPGKTVWYLNSQDVAAIGAWFSTGRLDSRRVVALGGPQVKTPRLLETRLGADLLQLTEDELVVDDNRIISGSILHGRAVAPPVQYLGRYAQQVSVLKEGHLREFLGWQKPGFDKFSIIRVFASSLSRDKRFLLTTSTEGSERAMVPIGTYERVMPLDVLPTPLLRALIVRDTDAAQQLGALELEEEDLALCTFVCPGKYEYGSILRDNLRKIEVEG